MIYSGGSCSRRLCRCSVGCVQLRSRRTKKKRVLSSFLLATSMQEIRRSSEPGIGMESRVPKGAVGPSTLRTPIYTWSRSTLGAAIGPRPLENGNVTRVLSGGARCVVPRTSVGPRPLQNAEIPSHRSPRARALVPGAAMRPCPLQKAEISPTGSSSARAFASGASV